MANSRDVIVILLDVGATMSRHGQSTKQLEECVRGITKLIEMKILLYPKDMVGVVLFGTNATNNKLAKDSPGSYAHVSVLQPIGYPDVELLRRLQDVKPEQGNSDFIDAMIVGIDALVGVEARKGYATHLRLFLVTDAAGTTNEADLEVIQNKMLELSIALNVVGIDFADEDHLAGDLDVKAPSSSQTNIKSDDNVDSAVKIEIKEELESWSQPSPNASSGAAAPVKSPLSSQVKPDSSATKAVKTDPKLARKRRNEAVLRKMCSQIRGSIFEVNEALDMMSAFEKRSVSPTPNFRGFLEIGKVVRVPVWMYLKTKEAGMPRLTSISKLSSETEPVPKANMDVDEGNEVKPSVERTRGVKIDKTYHAMDNPDEEIPFDQQMRGYKYGKTYVPSVNTIAKYTSEPCLQVIGFTPEETVPRHFYTTNSEMIVPYGCEENASAAISSLCHAMTRTGMVGIVRAVKRKNSTPMLGVISPKIGESMEYLYFNRLPFNDDLRTYGFASLIETEFSQEVPKHAIPTERQLNVTEDFINALDLGNAAVDHYGEPMEAIKPRNTFNPTLQYFYQVILHRALKPNLPLPTMDESIVQQLNLNEEHLRKAGGAMNNFHDAFVLTRTEVKEKETRKRFWSEAFTGDDVDDKLESYLGPDDPKKAKKKEDATPSGLHNIQALLRGGVDSVGNLTPVEDFQAMMARRDVDLVDKAIEEIQAQILRLVNDSYKNSHYDKAIECIGVLRAGCIKEQESEQFNTFLQLLKTSFKGKQRNDFWLAVQQKSINLIASTESGDSTVTLEEVRDFYASDPAPQDILSVDESTKATDKSGTAEDLFDLL